MKKTKIGYIGKSWFNGLIGVFEHRIDGPYDYYSLCDLLRTKHTKADWPEEDYPPVKVKITVEEI